VFSGAVGEYGPAPSVGSSLSSATKMVAVPESDTGGDKVLTTARTATTPREMKT